MEFLKSQINCLRNFQKKAEGNYNKNAEETLEEYANGIVEGIPKRTV